MSSRSFWGLVFSLVGIFIIFPCLSYGDSSRSAPLFRVADGYSYWIDTRQNADAISRVALQSRSWVHRPHASVNLGYQQQPVWLRFDVKAFHPQNIQLLMELGSSHLDQVEFYLTQIQDGAVSVLSSRVTGDQLGNSNALLKHRFPLFATNLRQPGDYQVFVRVSTTSSIIFPVDFKRPEAFFPEEAKIQVFYGLFFGMMFVLAFYNGMVWAFLRERAYLYNMAFIVFAMLYQSTINGFGSFYLWQNNAAINQKAYMVGTLLTMYFAGRFAIRFLDLRSRLPRLERFTFYFLQIFLFMLVPALLLPEHRVVGIIYFLETSVCFYAIAVLVHQCLTGNYWARYLLAGWSILILGALSFVASRIAWIEYTPAIEYLHAAGFSFGNLLVTSALAARIQKERIGKHLALEKALHLAQEVTQLTLEKEQMEASAREELEWRVEQKTETLNLMLRQLQSSNKKLEHATITDSLTGIGNRRFLDASFQGVIDQCQLHRTSLGVLVIDADYFKRVNDMHGHLVGDRCLQHIASILQRSARRNLDLLVRYGGEEFILVLPATDSNGVLTIAEEIRQSIESDSLSIQGKEIRLTVSVGVHVSVPDATDDAESLLLKADEALYTAKRKGRNRVEVYRHGLDPLKA